MYWESKVKISNLKCKTNDISHLISIDLEYEHTNNIFITELQNCPHKNNSKFSKIDITDVFFIIVSEGRAPWVRHIDKIIAVIIETVRTLRSQTKTSRF